MGEKKGSSWFVYLIILFVVDFVYHGCVLMSGPVYAPVLMLYTVYGGIITFFLPIISFLVVTLILLGVSIAWSLLRWRRPLDLDTLADIVFDELLRLDLDPEQSTQGRHATILPAVIELNFTFTRQQDPHLYEVVVKVEDALTVTYDLETNIFLDTTGAHDEELSDFAEWIAEDIRDLFKTKPGISNATVKRYNALLTDRRESKEEKMNNAQEF
jgi:hypothetical protein